MLRRERGGRGDRGALTDADPAPTPALAPPNPSPVPQGETRTVTSSHDRGRGELRQLLTDARPGDTIIFDPTVFPADDPRPIILETRLPQMTEDRLTVDASDAG